MLLVYNNVKDYSHVFKKDMKENVPFLSYLQLSSGHPINVFAEGSGPKWLGGLVPPPSGAPLFWEVFLTCSCLGFFAAFCIWFVGFKFFFFCITIILCCVSFVCGDCIIHVFALFAALLDLLATVGMCTVPLTRFTRCIFYQGKHSVLSRWVLLPTSEWAPSRCVADWCSAMDKWQTRLILDKNCVLWFFLLDTTAFWLHSIA